MTDVFIPRDKVMDPQAFGAGDGDFGKLYNRDQCRSPMQWDGSRNAGFSSAALTWLPVADNYTLNNVKLQQSQDISHLQVFKDLISLRPNPTMKYGAFEITALDEDVIVYKRQIKGGIKSDVFVIILNLGTLKKSIKLRNLFSEKLPRQMTVAVASVHSEYLVKG